MSEELDPASAKNVFIFVTHVVETHAGTFSVTVDDMTGSEWAKDVYVPDAEDMVDAMIKFWIVAREKHYRYNNRDNN